MAGIPRTSPEQQEGDVLGGFFSFITSVFSGEGEPGAQATGEQGASTRAEMNDEKSETSESKGSNGSERKSRKSAGSFGTARRKSASFFGALFGTDSESEAIANAEPRRKSSYFGLPKANKPAPPTEERGSFSAVLGLLEPAPTAEEIALAEARDKRIAEEAALLNDRLWEFLELKDESRLINEAEAKQVATALPAKHQMANWVLIYSTYRDGISMSTMYRKCYERGGANVIFIKDEAKHVFGGFVTCPLHITEGKHMGTGECFLFKLKPDFVVYKWTEQNRYFMMGDEDSFHMGSGEGRFGLWIDSTLTHGHSAQCETYGNEILASETDFKILGVEVWGFQAD